MQVFHGSDTRIEKIDLAKSEFFKDFGRGFYVTNNREHAYLRAMDVVKRRSSDKPVITVFEYTEAYPITVGMNIKMFENVSKEWVEFIMLNRNRRISHPAHTFDTEAILEAIISDFKETEYTAIKAFYLSDVYKKLSNTDTLLWKESWQSIYMTLKEQFANETEESN